MGPLQDLNTLIEVLVNGLDTLSKILAILAVVVGALWVYTKFVIEKGSFPGAQFDIELATIGMQQERKIVEFLIHLRNIGSSTLVVKNIRFDLLYLREGQNAALFDDGPGLKGKVYFPNSICEDISGRIIPLHHPELNHTAEPGQREQDHALGKAERGLPVVKRNTFVLPSVLQTYTFVTAIPRDTSHVLAFASFEYETELSRVNSAVLNLSRRLGLIQHSMTHINERHTSERLFKIA